MFGSSSTTSTRPDRARRSSRLAAPRASSPYGRESLGPLESRLGTTWRCPTRPPQHDLVALDEAVDDLRVLLAAQADPDRADLLAPSRPDGHRAGLARRSATAAVGTKSTSAAEAT